MKQNVITTEQCIELMKEKFLDFSVYWESYIRDFGLDLGLHVQMIPFGEYALDKIKSNDESAKCHNDIFFGIFDEQGSR